MQDTVHLIIAGAGTIGSHVARRIVEAGGKVAVSSRDESRAAALASDLGGKSIALDATDLSAMEAAVKDVAAWGGRLDGIVNCAGSILLKPAHLTTADEFNQTVQTNLVTAFNTVRAATPALRKAGGSIVLLGTAAAEIGLANHEAIAAAKAGVVGLMRSAAATYAANGIRINVVAPGLVDTPLAEKITSNEMALKASTAMHPLGRIGQPADIARVICFLLDPESGWITGQTLAVDGGLSSLKARAKA